MSELMCSYCYYKDDIDDKLKGNKTVSGIKDVKR